MPSRFRNRAHAGRALARALTGRVDPRQAAVLGLPRGGVPVAAEVARELGAPLDVFVVRKIGVPGHAELAMGAVASGGRTVSNERVIEQSGVTPEEFAAARDRELAEAEQRSRAYRGDRPALELAGREVVLVDDGLATGATMRAAVAALRQHAPARIVAAVPVGAAQSCAAVAAEADDVVCVVTPDRFGAVGAYYDVFDQTDDEEVIRLLDGR